MKKNGIIVVLLVIVAFLLGVVFSGSKDQTAETDQQNNEEQEEFAQKKNEEDFDITDLSASGGGGVGLALGSGEYMFRYQNDSYEFDGVFFDFLDLSSISMAPIFEGAPPTIQVRMFFKNFKRNGASIDLAGFRLGIYQGSCNEVESIPELGSHGEFLGAVQCWWAGIGKQIAVFQEGKFVKAKIRTIAEEDQAVEPLQDLTVIDMSQLVQ